MGQLWSLRGGGTAFRQFADDTLLILLVLLHPSNLVEVDVGRAIVDRPPAHQLDQGRDQGSAFLGQGVDDLPSVCGVWLLGDDAAALEPVESISQDVGRYAFGRGEELLKIVLLYESHIAHDQEAPFIAQQIQGTANRAARPPRICIEHHSLFFLHESLALCKELTRP